MGKARHVECSIEEYHRRPEYSRSQLEVLAASPPLFYGRFLAKPPLYPREASRALELGTAAHTLLSSFADRDQLVEIPEEVLSANGARLGKAWDQFATEHAGKILLKAAEMATCRAMIRHVYDHPIGRRIVAEALHYEYSVVWTDAETGLDLRCRPDILWAGRPPVLVDFKTTRATDRDAWRRECVRYGYHRQIAWYLDGLNAFQIQACRGLFLAVDKSPAYEVRVFELPEDAIALGRQQNRENLRDLARRLDEDDWTSVDGREILLVDLPTWAYPDIQLKLGSETCII